MAVYCHCFCVSLTQGPGAWFRKSTAERESKPDSMRGASEHLLPNFHLGRGRRNLSIIPKNTRNQQGQTSMMQNGDE